MKLTPWGARTPGPRTLRTTPPGTVSWASTSSLVTLRVTSPQDPLPVGRQEEATVPSKPKCSSSSGPVIHPELVFRAPRTLSTEVRGTPGIMSPKASTGGPQKCTASVCLSSLPVPSECQVLTTAWAGAVGVEGSGLRACPPLRYHQSPLPEAELAPLCCGTGVAPSGSGSVVLFTQVVQGSLHFC